MRAVALRLLLAVCLLLSVEIAVFRSGFYAAIVEPDSTTGRLESVLRNERLRRVQDRRQVLAVGDSRMALRARIANELAAETGYTFGSIALAGTTPRCWYYMIRDVDPTARRYAAVVIPVYDYVDEDFDEDFRDREADLHYLIARLGVADITEFTASFADPTLRRKVALGLILKSSVYKRDFQQLLLRPRARLFNVPLSRKNSARWNYEYTGEPLTLKGLTVDWKTRTAQIPESATDAQREMIRNNLLRADSLQTGAKRAYLRYWFGRIARYYEGSGTKLIFFRLPRGPVVRPAVTPVPGVSSVRELAARPNVLLLDEHRFDELETPELFMDAWHLNAEGNTRFSRILARDVRRALEPPRN